MAAPKYLKNVNGTLTEQVASESSGSEVIVATNSSGQIDISFMPTGIGPDTVSVTASEALAAGDFVNIYDNSGAKLPQSGRFDDRQAGARLHPFLCVEQ